MFGSSGCAEKLEFVIYDIKAVVIHQMMHSVALGVCICVLLCVCELLCRWWTNLLWLGRCSSLQEHTAALLPSRCRST